MQKKFIALLFLAAFIGIKNSPVRAQQAAKVKLQKVPLSKAFLPYQNPFEEEASTLKVPSDPSPKKAFGAAQKEIMQRMSEIYQIQVQSMQAQVKNDMLAAEEHITGALKGIKKLLDDYPQVKGSNRFNELYRTVYTEYRQFYGIAASANPVKGKIFAIRKELNSDNYDWIKRGYVLPENLMTPDITVPLIRNEYVNRRLKYFTYKRPGVMESWLRRSERYFPMMRRIFEKVGVPTELIHLSMIESGLNSTAESWASAMGMWQFMEATGSAYGLDVNWWVDERRDPVKATWAAARHLRDLYEVWGDWHLAIAGYNISPTGLKSAIRDGGGEKSYWSAYPYLPNETQGYIPGFIAATMIGLHPEEFGFKEHYYAEPYDYELVDVAPLMPLDVLAEAAGVSTEKLKEYNPELLRWATPPGSEYSLKIPPGTKDLFVANYQDIPEDQRSLQIVTHTVQKGETLGHIAYKYGTSVQALYETNQGLSSLIRPGQKIIIPLRRGSSEQLSSSRQPEDSASTDATSEEEDVPAQQSETEKVYYTVKSGDTIGHIAEWFDVRASQMRDWNNTSNLINVGDRLVVFVPSSKKAYYTKVNSFSPAKKQSIEAGGKIVQYQVQKNDTLLEIADVFGVSVDDIKQANHLEDSRIYVGQRLEIAQAN